MLLCVLGDLRWTRREGHVCVRPSLQVIEEGGRSSTIESSVLSLALVHEVLGLLGEGWAGAS